MEPRSQPKSKGHSFDVRLCLTLLALFIITVIFWDSVVFYPVKLFVVILHEFSHGLAALATGGRIVEIQVNQQIGGHCVTAGGLGFVILCAGYIGSMTLGGLTLLIASKTNYDRFLANLIGVGLIVLTIFYIRNLFGILFTAGFAVGLLLIANLANAKVIDFLMKFLGMTCCLYAIIDIKEDLIDRTVQGSDAYELAKMLGFPGLSMVIGLVWVVIAAAVFLYILKASSFNKSEPDRAENTD